MEATFQFSAMFTQYPLLLFYVIGIAHFCIYSITPVVFLYVYLLQKTKVLSRLKFAKILYSQSILRMSKDLFWSEIKLG